MNSKVFDFKYAVAGHPDMRTVKEPSVCVT
jgi:hypothetical protein